jgi:hypothetical protein
MTPADTVTAPPRKNRSAYSYHFVLLSAGRSNPMFVGVTSEI